jgi:p-aminobenzoyl-glutamate transporter AbgT
MTHYFTHVQAEIIKEAFSMDSLANLFFFMAFFFTVAPLSVYIFARVKLLDGET